MIKRYKGKKEMDQHDPVSYPVYADDDKDTGG